MTDTPARPPARPAEDETAPAPPEQTAAVRTADDDPRPDEPRPDDPRPDEPGTGSTDDGATDDGATDDGAAGHRGLSLPLVPVLAVLLVLLVAGCVALWVTRPGDSAVRTDDYVGALQAARAGIVDVASFDYVTLDDDIEQIRRVATGDLRDASVSELEDRRQEITELEAVVNTEIIGAGVTRADSEDATVLLVIQATQESAASEQVQVSRYRLEVTLEKSGERWLLSGITGTGSAGDD